MRASLESESKAEMQDAALHKIWDNRTSNPFFFRLIESAVSGRRRARLGPRDPRVFLFLFFGGVIIFF